MHYIHNIIRSVGDIHCAFVWWSERRKRTANGRQDGGHENVIVDSGIHGRMVRGEGMCMCGVLWKSYSLAGVRGEGDVNMMVC